MSLQISNRNNMMQESPIRKLAPFADRAKEKGIKVYHLNIGQPDIKTPEGMRAAYRETPEIVAYGPSAGLTSYRKKLPGITRAGGLLSLPMMCSSLQEEAKQLYSPSWQLFLPEMK